MKPNERSILAKQLREDRDKAIKTVRRQYISALREIQKRWVKGNAAIKSGRDLGFRGRLIRRLDYLQSRKRGTLLTAIQQGSESLPEFTLDQLIKWIEQNYSVLGASGRKSTIGSVLSRQLKRGDLITVRKGKCGSPQIYRRKGEVK
jgi:hypothetical protein